MSQNLVRLQTENAQLRREIERLTARQETPSHNGSSFAPVWKQVAKEWRTQAKALQDALSRIR